MNERILNNTSAPLNEKAPLQIEYGGSRIKNIDVENVRTPEKINAGESEIVFMRNGSDNRDADPSSSEFGALKPEEIKNIKNDIESFCDKLIEFLPPEEREKIDFMVMSGASNLIMPDGKTSKHSRTLDSANEALQAIKISLDKYGLSEGQLLTPEPVRLKELSELKMLEDSSEFVDFLVEKYGTEKNFWVAYEVDLEKKKRLEMGVEGPKDIAGRVNDFLKIIKHNLEICHKERPNRRVVAFAYATYDTMSPWFKEHVVKVATPEEYYMPVKHRGGTIIKIDKNGDATTKINGNLYSLDI
jgi:hypothetical protein